MSFEITFEGMQAKPWRMHGLRRFGHMKHGQHDLQTPRMNRLDAGFFPVRKNTSSPLCENDLIMVSIVTSGVSESQGQQFRELPCLFTQAVEPRQTKRDPHPPRSWL